MKYSAIIVAAGSATRFKSQLNKVWIPLRGKPVLWHSIEKFLSDSECTQVVVAVSRNDEKMIQKLKKEFPQIVTVWGGTCREESVFNALKIVSQEYVLIHDAARPFFSMNLLQSIKTELVHTKSVIPALQVKENDVPDRIVEIEGVSYRIQTPQGFHSKFLIDAFNLANEEKKLHLFRDDASILDQYLGIKATLIKGEIDNFKITYPEDLPNT